MLGENQKIYLKYYATFIGTSLLVIVSCLVLLLKQVISPRFMVAVLLVYLITSFFVLSTTFKKKYE